MKPSERIWEIRQEYMDFGGTETSAIRQYLDEERERVNGVLHELVHAIHDGTHDTHNMNYIHDMIDEKLAEPSEK